MIIKTKAYPRSGLIGNPSDGYFGKTISFTFSNFSAEVVLYETPELQIMPNYKDESVFNSIQDLVKDVALHGYYGGIRLLKATVKRFFNYCRNHDIELHNKNFTIRYHSNIPHGVGLAGSSAIITACLRALTSFYGVSIPKYIAANLILSAELNELGILAGLQDRVCQVYEGLVYMDFEKDHMTQNGYGHYEYLDHRLLGPLYVAYCEQLSEPTEIFHNNIRERFELGEKVVVDSMIYWSRLTDRFKKCLLKGETEKIPLLINSNFDRRKKIYKISQRNLQMIEAARAQGASAKFTGSGGAIVGTYKDDQMFRALKKNLGKLQAKVIKPIIVKSVS